MINSPFGYHADDMMLEALYQQGSAICKSKTKALHGFNYNPPMYNDTSKNIPLMPTNKDKTKNILLAGGAILLGLCAGKKVYSSIKGILSKLFKR